MLWKDFGRVSGYFVSNSSTISKLELDYKKDACDTNKNVYPTKELAEASLALCQLLQWRNKVWEEDNNWTPDWDNSNQPKYPVIFILGMCTMGARILVFSNRELRDNFSKNHKSLIEKASLLLL